MKRLFAGVFGLAVLAFVLAAGTLTVTPSLAQEADFSARSLEGTWGFSADGVTLQDDEVFHQVVVGLFSFDGIGGCSLSFTGNFGGTTAPGTAEECTYEVNSDGTGTIGFSVEGAELSLAFVIVDGADEFRFITLGEELSSGVAKRQ